MKMLINKQRQELGNTKEELATTQQQRDQFQASAAVALEELAAAKADAETSKDELHREVVALQKQLAAVGSRAQGEVLVAPDCSAVLRITSSPSRGFVCTAHAARAEARTALEKSEARVSALEEEAGHRDSEIAGVLVGIGRSEVFFHVATFSWHTQCCAVCVRIELRTKLRVALRSVDGKCDDGRCRDCLSSHVCLVWQNCRRSWRLLTTAMSHHPHSCCLAQTNRKIRPWPPTRRHERRCVGAWTYWRPSLRRRKRILLLCSRVVSKCKAK